MSGFWFFFSDFVMLECWNVVVLLWNCEIVELWNYGIMELWSCGIVELLNCGVVELWSCWIVELWSCGVVKLWRYIFVIVCLRKYVFKMPYLYLYNIHDNTIYNIIHITPKLWSGVIAITIVRHYNTSII